MPVQPAYQQPALRVHRQCAGVLEVRDLRSGLAVPGEGDDLEAARVAREIGLLGGLALDDPDPALGVHGDRSGARCGKGANLLHRRRRQHSDLAGGVIAQIEFALAEGQPQDIALGDGRPVIRLVAASRAEQAGGGPDIDVGVVCRDGRCTAAEAALIVVLGDESCRPCTRPRRPRLPPLRPRRRSHPASRRCHRR